MLLKVDRYVSSMKVGYFVMDDSHPKVFTTNAHFDLGRAMHAPTLSRLVSVRPTRLKIGESNL